MTEETPFPLAAQSVVKAVSLLTNKAVSIICSLKPLLDCMLIFLAYCCCFPSLDLAISSRTAFVRAILTDHEQRCPLERATKARIKQQYLLGDQTELYCTWCHPKKHQKTEEREFSNCKMLIRNCPSLCHYDLNKLYTRTLGLHLFFTYFKIFLLGTSFYPCSLIS